MTLKRLNTVKDALSGLTYNERIEILETLLDLYKGKNRGRMRDNLKEFVKKNNLEKKIEY